MTKEKEYQIKIRSYAKECLESGADSCTYAVIEISRRTEKTFLNRYIKTLTNEIADLKSFNMMDRIPLLEKSLQICNDRLELLSN